jgi:hypothetical protein
MGNYGFLFTLLSVLIASCSIRPLPGDATSTPEIIIQVTLPAETDSTAPRTSEQVANATSPTVANDFDLEMAEAFQARDLPTIRNLMHDRFSFATLDADLIEIAAEKAIDRLANSYLAPGANPQVQFGLDVRAALGGRDPLGEWGPTANPVQALLVTGLGPQAAAEAVLVIAHDLSQDELYFHGMLVPGQERFFVSTREPSASLATQVQLVRALQGLNVRSGPGTQFEVVGFLLQDETADVTGISYDGGWWRITCEVGYAEICWISADPDLTEPLSQP